MKISPRPSFSAAPAYPPPAASLDAQRTPRLAQLLDHFNDGTFNDGKPFSRNQQKQTLHLLALLDKSVHRDCPSELNGRSVELRDNDGTTFFSWEPEDADSSIRIAIQTQGDGLFHAVGEDGERIGSGGFLHALLSALRGVDADIRQAEADDLARRMAQFAHRHAEEVERQFERLASAAPEPAATAGETTRRGDIQEDMLANVLTRTASQVVTRMAARLLDQAMEATVLEGITLDDLAQLRPALAQFRRGEGSLTQRLQSLADALGRVARTADGIAATAQQYLGLCTKMARLAEMIDSEGVSLDTAQKALVQLDDALAQTPLQAWSEASGTRAALVQTSQWLGELAPLLGHQATLASFLGSLHENPTLRQLLSVHYQGWLEIFDELGALFSALRERRAQCPTAPALSQAAWLLDVVDSGRLGPLLSVHLGSAFTPLVEGLQGVRQTLQALRQFPAQRSALQQLQWLAERLSGADIETALPETLRNSVAAIARRLAGMACVQQEIGPLPHEASLREQAMWLAQGLQHVEIKALAAEMIGPDDGLAMLKAWLVQANDPGQESGQESDWGPAWAAAAAAQTPAAARRWLRELARDDSAMALLEPWLAPGTRQTLMAWVAPLEQALRLAPHLDRYPGSGQWQDKLSWGAQLLISPEAPALMQQFLPESLACWLVAPFEALRQARDFPTDATPLAQLAWTTGVLGSPHNQALLRQYAPAGCDQWLAQLEALTSLSQGAAALQRTLASDSAWSGKVTGVAQLLMQPLAAELKRQPALLLRTASWASGGSRTTVGAALTALRLYATLPDGLSHAEKARWIAGTALREVLNEYSATLSLAVSHGDRFGTLLAYARQTRDLYQAWSDPQRMERELESLGRLLKRDLPLPETLKPLLDALPALPALLHAHQHYQAQAPGLPWPERLSHLGGQLSQRDRAALKRILDNLEAYVVTGLVDSASRAMQALHDSPIHDPLTFPGAAAATLPRHASASAAAQTRSWPALASIAGNGGIDPTAQNATAQRPSAQDKAATASGAGLAPKTAAYAMTVGGALGLMGSLGLLGYSLYRRKQQEPAVPPWVSPAAQAFNRPPDSPADAAGSAPADAESAQLIAASDRPIRMSASPVAATSLPALRPTGLSASTPALVMLGLLAGAVMARGIHDLNKAADETAASALAPVDEFAGLALAHAADRLAVDMHAVLRHGQHRKGSELQRAIDDIDQALAVLADIEGAWGIEPNDGAEGTLLPLAGAGAGSRNRRDVGGADYRLLGTDIHAIQDLLDNVRTALREPPNDLGAVAHLKQGLLRLRRYVESLQPNEADLTPTADRAILQARKAARVIEAVDRLLETPEFPPGPVDFLDIQLTAIAARHGCLGKVDRHTKVNIDYVSQRARYGLHTMIQPERRSTHEFGLIDILRRAHVRFLKKHNANPGSEKMYFSDHTLPRALLNDILATDVEAQYRTLIGNFRAGPEKSDAPARERSHRIREQIRQAVQSILNRIPDYYEADSLRGLLHGQRACKVKLLMPGVIKSIATLKDVVFVDTKSGGGILLFLNSRRAYRLPDAWGIRKNYIEANRNLQNDLKSALPLNQRLALGNSSIVYTRISPPSWFVTETTHMWTCPLVFEQTQDIVAALSDIGLAHDEADMDTLAVSDQEISWDKWMGTLSFASTVLSLALPVAAAMPRLAGQAMLLGVLNTVQILGLSVAPNILKSIYADLPEERSQALREALIGVIVEIGGWKLTFLSALEPFNALSEKVARIISRMKATAKAECFAQQFAETWKNNRKRLLGSLDQAADAMPFHMESLPAPILNRLDKHLMKLAVTNLLPDARNDSDLDRLLDQLEHRRRELLGHQQGPGNSSTIVASIREGHAPAELSPLNQQLGQMAQRIMAWVLSFAQDDVFAIINAIKIEINELDFKSYHEAEESSPSARQTRKLTRDLKEALLHVYFYLQPAEGRIAAKAEVDFNYLYEAIAQAIERGLGAESDAQPASSPLIGKLKTLLKSIPPSIEAREILALMRLMDEQVSSLDSHSYFIEHYKNSASALVTRELVGKLELRLHELKWHIYQSAPIVSSADRKVIDHLYARITTRLAQKFPTSMIVVNDYPPPSTSRPANRVTP